MDNYLDLHVNGNSNLKLLYFLDIESATTSRASRGGCAGLPGRAKGGRRKNDTRKSPRVQPGSIASGGPSTGSQPESREQRSSERDDSDIQSEKLIISSSYESIDQCIPGYFASGSEPSAPVSPETSFHGFETGLQRGGVVSSPRRRRSASASPPRSELICIRRRRSSSLDTPEKRQKTSALQETPRSWRF